MLSDARNQTHNLGAIKIVQCVGHLPFTQLTWVQTQNHEWFSDPYHKSLGRLREYQSPLVPTIVAKNKELVNSCV